MVVTFQVSVIDEDVFVDTAPAGNLPVTVRIKVSLFGSIADTVTWAVVLTVTLITNGPLVNRGGKFSAGNKNVKEFGSASE